MANIPKRTEFNVVANNVGSCEAEHCIKETNLFALNRRTTYWLCAVHQNPDGIKSAKKRAAWMRTFVRKEQRRKQDET